MTEPNKSPDNGAPADQPNAQPIQDVFSNQPNVSLLDNLVGEGKKYKTVEDLAKAKLAADNHIKTLEDEGKNNRELLTKLTREVEEGYNSKTVLEELLNKKKDPKDAVQQQPLNEEQIESIFEKVVSKQSEKQNLDSVNKKLSEVFGTDSTKKVQEKLTELNIDMNYFKSVAGRSPQAALNLIGVTSTPAQDNGAPPSKPTANVPSVDNQGKTPVQRFNDEMTAKNIRYNSPQYWKEMNKSPLFNNQ